MSTSLPPSLPLPPLLQWTGSIVSFQVPSDELVEGLTQLVRYITVVVVPATATGAAGVAGRDAAAAAAPRPLRRPAQGPSAAWLPESYVATVPVPPRLLAPPATLLRTVASAGAPVQAVSRKLYRFLRCVCVSVCACPHHSQRSREKREGGAREGDGGRWHV